MVLKFKPNFKRQSRLNNPECKVKLKGQKSKLKKVGVASNVKK